MERPNKLDNTDDDMVAEIIAYEEEEAKVDIDLEASKLIDVTEDFRLCFAGALVLLAR